MKRRDSFLWILALSALLYLAAAPRFYVGHFGDDARDILAAKSLLHGSYRNLQLPGHPPLNFPLPGFPLFLAPFVALASSHLGWLKILPILLTLGSVARIRRLWEPELSPAAAGILTAICAFNPTTLSLSGRLIADSAYLFAALSAFWFLRHPPGARRDAMLWMAAAWAALLRPEGILLVLALALALLWTRQGRSFLGVAGAGMLWVGVMLWNYIRTGSPSGYLSFWKETLPFLSGGSQTLFVHGAALLKSLVLEVLFGVSIEPVTGFQRLLVSGLVAACLVVIIAGWVRWIKSLRTHPGLGVAVSLYCFLHVWVHGAWLAVDAHYLWPLLPFAAFFVIYAVDHLRARLIKVAAGIPLAVLIFGLYGWQSAFAVYETLKPPAENRLPTETLEWIRSQTPSDAFCLAPHAAALTLYTGRYSAAFVGGSDPDDFRSRLLEGGFTHLVRSPLRFLHVRTIAQRDPLTVWRRAVTWLAREPGSYEPLYWNDREQSGVYRIKSAPDFQRAYARYRVALKTLGAQPNPDGSAQLEKLETVLQIHAFPAALNAYGVAAILSGRHVALARRRLEQAVRKRPDFTVAWVNLARVHRRLGQRVLARRAYDRALESLGLDTSQAFLAPVILQERQAL